METFATAFLTGSKSSFMGLIGSLSLAAKFLWYQVQRKTTVNSWHGIMLLSSSDDSSLPQCVLISVPSGTVAVLVWNVTTKGVL